MIKITATVDSGTAFDIALDLVHKGYDFTLSAADDEEEE